MKIYEIRQQLKATLQQYPPCETVDAILPIVTNLFALAEEYEHALSHQADIKTHKFYKQEFCEGCAGLAQSALDGVNRPDFQQMAQDFLDEMGEDDEDNEEGEAND